MAAEGDPEPFADASVDAMGEHIKELERVHDARLDPALPFIIRLDGRAFHSIKPVVKPFDERFYGCMVAAAKALMQEFRPAFAFMQSDEISLVFAAHAPENTPFFNLRIQKLVSLAASVASVAFNGEMHGTMGDARAPSPPTFDARVLQGTSEEMLRAVRWRMADCARNAILGAGTAKFGYEGILGFSPSRIVELLVAEDREWWFTLPDTFKQGVCLQYHKVEKVGRDPRTGEEKIITRRVLRWESYTAEELSTALLFHDGR